MPGYRPLGRDRRGVCPASGGAVHSAPANDHQHRFRGPRHGAACFSVADSLTYIAHRAGRWCVDANRWRPKVNWCPGFNHPDFERLLGRDTDANLQERHPEHRAAGSGDRHWPRTPPEWRRHVPSRQFVELQRRHVHANDHIHSELTMISKIAPVHRTQVRTIAALLLLVGVAQTAAAQVSVEVSPLRVELQAGPGSTTTQPVTLTNYGKETGRVRARLTDWDLTRDGTPQFEGADAGRYSATSWVRLAPPEQTIEPGASAIVRFSASLPEGVEPGGYRTGILFEFEPETRTAAPKRELAFKSRIATLIYINSGTRCRRTSSSTCACGRRIPASTSSPLSELRAPHRPYQGNAAVVRRVGRSRPRSCGSGRAAAARERARSHGSRRHRRRESRSRGSIARS